MYTLYRLVNCRYILKHMCHIGSCQRPVYTGCHPTYIHEITNMWHCYWIHTQKTKNFKVFYCFKHWVWSKLIVLLILTKYCIKKKSKGSSQPWPTYFQILWTFVFVFYTNCYAHHFDELLQCTITVSFTWFVIIFFNEKFSWKIDLCSRKSNHNLATVLHNDLRLFILLLHGVVRCMRGLAH